MELRAQVAYHFKFDPTQAAKLPDMITCTVSVGDEVRPEKVSYLAIGPKESAVLMELMKKAMVEATRTAKPVDATQAAIIAEEDGPNEEEEAF